jgi:hypothetical protein
VRGGDCKVAPYSIPPHMCGKELRGEAKVKAEVKLEARS